ncbi:MAG: DNA-binding transcriptional LysR family regulator [Myxococcota bacterium]|jgi:DNA-binding transcriptional LysR family regulator
MSASTGFESFVTIVEEGGISQASRKLDVPRPTLSRRLAALEAELGVRLMHRSSRRMVLTAAGEELYRRARRIVVDAREARLAVARLDGVPRGLLRVSIPPGPQLTDTLSRFLDRYPEVELEVVSTARFVDLVAEGFDVAVRAGTSSDPGLITRTLWTVRRMVFASEGYTAQHGQPQTPADLSEHRCILGFARGEIPHRRWPLLEGGEVAVSGRLTTNNLQLATSECGSGRGLALLPEALGRAAGLIPVLPGVIGDRPKLSVVYPSRELLDPKVRAFVDLLVEDVAAATASGGLLPGVQSL